MSRLYVLYDGRAELAELGLIDTGDCTVYTTCDTLADALRERAEQFPGSVIYSFEASGPVLADRRIEVFSSGWVVGNP